MTLEVRVYATLRKYVPEAVAGLLSVDVPAATTIRELIETLRIDPAEVAIIMVNGLHGELDRVLVDNDRVGLFPPVGGG